MKKIFTFWEPKGNLHPYLKLCMKTWEKYLPDYEIVLLDYENIDKWLGKDFFDKTLYTDYSLDKQADAIRCALLEKYGGIWLDVDTIITSKDIIHYFKIDSDLVLVNTHIGFIIAKAHSEILKKWLKGIKYRLFLHKLCKDKIVKEFIRIFNKDFVKNLEEWHFLGNGILNKHLKKASPKEYHRLDRVDLNILPERRLKQENSIEMSNDDLYRYFYFEQDYTDYVMDNTSGFICLHNSWTPDEYKSMSEEQILAQNNTISNVFKKVLY